MFNVILITCETSNIINYNIEILKNDCRVIVVDYIGNANIPNNDISIYKYRNSDKHDCLNETIRSIDGDIIIIDEDVKVTNHFIESLKSHYDNTALNLLRLDIVRDILITDPRLGKISLTNDDINLNIAFNTNTVKSIDNIYLNCRNNNIPIKLLRNVKVTQYLTNKSSMNMRTNIIKRNPLTRPTKRDRDIKNLISGKHKIRKNLTYDIIIPFMYNDDRFDLFEASIKCLYSYFKNNDRVNIIVHETAPERHLTTDFIKKYGIKYIFSKWEEVFHRAWALNVPAKHLSTADIFVFFDADLLITDEWVDELLNCSNSMVYIGWGKMYNLDKNATQHYINTGELIERYERIRIPNPNAAAGGINIIPSPIFFDIKGWDESFRNTYGGEDNVLHCKLQKLGYKPNNFFKSAVYHLYHEHKTYRNPKRFMLLKKMALYDKQKWLRHIESTKWGEFSKHTVINPTIEHDIVVSDNKNIEKTDDKILDILWCKMDTSNRVAGHYEHLIKYVDKKCNLSMFRKNIGHTHPAVFQQRMINGEIQDDDVQHIINNQHKFDAIVITQSFAFSGEWEKVTTPVFMILEDQHGENNRYQIKSAIKYGWTILTRYKPKPFNDDINDNVKKWIWYPHSVNTDIFQDYGLEKEIVLLQTGAIYKVYETRVFVKEYFDKQKNLGPNWYRYIPRPKETDMVKWPVGIDYAKEINKAWMTVCCGSKMQYPVMKYFEIPAAGSIVYGDYFDELGELGFIPDENMIVIDKNDIMGQLHSIRGNKNFMYDIIHNGKELIKNNYSMEKGAEKLIKIIKEEI